MVQVGIYCDLPPKALLEAAPKLVELGHVTRFFIGVEGSDGRRIYTPDAFLEVSLELGANPDDWDSPRAAHPVLWPRADTVNAAWLTWVTSMYGGAPRFDWEENGLNAPQWLSRTLEDYFPFRSVTTHPGHPELAGKKDRHLCRLAEELEVQALSTKTAVAKWGTQYRPGDAQRLAFAKGKGANGLVPELALPLYGQKGIPGMTAEQAMETALVTALELGVQKVSYWSLRNALKNEYAWNFLRDRVPELIGK